VPALLPALRSVSGLAPDALIRDVLLPWASRALPLLSIAALLGVATAGVPIWLAIPLGGLVGLTALFASRQLILDYPPVAQVVRAKLAVFRLDGLVLASQSRQPNA